MLLNALTNSYLGLRKNKDKCKAQPISKVQIYFLLILEGQFFFKGTHRLPNNRVTRLTS